MRLSPSTATLRQVRRRRRGRLLLLLLAVVALAVVGLGGFRAGPAPAITVTPALPAIGRSTPIAVEVSEPARGIAAVRAELVQGETVVTLVEETYATPAGWRVWERGTTAKSFALEAGKDVQPALVEGEAVVRVVARPAPAWFRAGGAAQVETRLPVRLKPPVLEVLSSQHYVSQGGSEVVVYRVGATSVRDGVEVGGWFFPGWSAPGAPAGERFALFAVPHDVGDAAQVRLVAADDVANTRSAAFVDKFFPSPPRQDEIELDDRFLAKVVPEIRENTPELADQGSLLDNYLQINRELRRTNSAELRALAAKTRPEFLWREPFLPFPGGQVMSAFADRRTYVYQGRTVDQQDHLGFDLASTARAPVPAANDGVVVLARYFGIFGNAVVVDHGYGLMSLYAHLSSLGVEEGQTVARGQSLGRSGATGLAGGDHLHFTFLLHGLPVRPIEWWDPHWITDRLKRKLGAALPFAG